MAISRSVSDRIHVARVLCIFLLIYVHITIGKPVPLTGSVDFYEILNVIKLLLRDGLGRVSVPLLGIISGYIAFDSYSSRGYGPLLKSKAGTLLRPMVMWSILMLLCMVAVGLLSSDMGYIREVVPQGYVNSLNAVFGITDKPVNVPLFFLRDLFVCFCFVPLLLKLIKISVPLVVACSLGVILFSDYLALNADILGVPVFLRPSILGFFWVGLVIRSGNLDQFSQPLNRLVSNHLLLIFLVFSIATIYPFILALLKHETGSGAVPVLVRMSGLLFIWGLTIRMANSSFAANLIRLSRSTFFIFCSHMIIIFLVTQFIGTVYSWAPPQYVNELAFLFMPVICFFLGTLVWTMLELKLPKIAKITTGGRT